MQAFIHKFPSTPNTEFFFGHDSNNVFSILCLRGRNVFRFSRLPVISRGKIPITSLRSYLVDRRNICFAPGHGFRRANCRVAISTNVHHSGVSQETEVPIINCPYTISWIVLQSAAAEGSHWKLRELPQSSSSTSLWPQCRKLQTERMNPPTGSSLYLQGKRHREGRRSKGFFYFSCCC